MAIEQKYGQVTTEFGDIPPNEPVFLLRAQDSLAPVALAAYQAACAATPGVTALHTREIDGSVEAFQEWYRHKLPSS